MRVLVVVIVLQLISVITGSEDLAEDQRREICRDLGFVATNDFITVKFQGLLLYPVHTLDWLTCVAWL